MVLYFKHIIFSSLRDSIFKLIFLRVQLFFSDFPRQFRVAFNALSAEVNLNRRE